MPNPTDAAAGAGAAASAGAPARTPGPRALLVDDRPGPREAVARALRRTLPQVRLEVAASREEARPLIERAAAGAGDAPYDFAVLRDGMAWGEDMRLPQFLRDALPAVPQILTCDPSEEENPAVASDPAEAPREADRHGLAKAITIAGDDVPAVTAAAEACLKLAGPPADAARGPADRDEDARSDGDDPAAGPRPPADLPAQLAAERRKVVALLRAAEQTAAREAAARRRLARVLHEDMLQTLVGARMFLSCARAVAADGRDPAPGGGGGGPDPLEEVDGLLLRSVQMCKDLTGLWSPLVLYEAGLVAALRWLGGDRDAAGAYGADLGGPGGALAGGPGDDHGGDGPDPGDPGGEEPGATLGPLPAGLSVAVDCEDGAEPDTQDGRLLLYQAAVELLANVARHAGVGEATLTLAVRPPAGGDGGDGGVEGKGDGGGPAMLALTVRDAGRGFDAAPPGGAAPVGERFGLFGLRERLALAGGSLEIESVAGQGTRVTALCPRTAGREARRPVFADAPAGPPDGPGTAFAADAPPDSRAVTADPEPPAADPPAPAAPLRVLIADDNRIIQLSVGSLLAAAADVEVVGRAADGAEAVSLALELNPDVVLMDVSMPKLDGVEATRRIRAAAPRVRVIGLSMHETDDRERDMFEAGAERYVVKDGPPETLLHALRHPPAAPLGG